jgi:DNA repair exonuclease SbcCD ATPase subunit
LCFGVAVMKTVAERQAIKFEQVFLDEFLDGLDENFKTKAFRFLESLAMDYGSMFVVEHSESFKSMFSNSYKVSLIDGKSQIEQA